MSALIFLAAPAIRDAGHPLEADYQQLNLGDSWWSIAERADNHPLQEPARRRALLWYERAFPRLSVVPRAKLAARLESYWKAVRWFDALTLDRWRAAGLLFWREC